MRKLIAITQVSVDGVMQAPGGPEEDTSNGFNRGGWAMPFVDEAARQIIAETIAGPFDLLLGRRTYDIFAGYWPNQDDAIAKAFNMAAKYAVTRDPSRRFDWKISHPVSGNVVAELKRLKASDGPPLHLWGSSDLLQTLIAAGLVDEHRLWVFPVVLGSGKRLFETGVPPRRLTLAGSRSTPSGILASTYCPAGPLPAA